MAEKKSSKADKRLKTTASRRATMQHLAVTLNRGQWPKKITNISVHSEKSTKSKAKMSRAKTAVTNARNILDESVRRQMAKSGKPGGPSLAAVRESTRTMAGGAPLIPSEKRKQKQKKKGK